MRKGRGSLLQRMLAVLLAAVLVFSMTSDAASVTALANEPGGQYESTDESAGAAEEDGEGEIVSEYSQDGTELPEIAATERAANMLQAAATHKHPVCGESCGHSDESHTDVEWTALTQDSITAGKGDSDTINGVPFDYYTLSAGNYYLTGNITIDRVLRISDNDGEVNLCFNGHTITSTFNKTNNNIGSLLAYSKLNVCDCVGGGGLTNSGQYVLISRGTTSLYGGKFSGGDAVYVSGGTFTLDGAALEATRVAVNVQAYNKAIIKSGSATSSGSFTLEIYTTKTTGFTMSGGTVTNTRSSGSALWFSSDTVGTITGGTIIAQGSSGKGVAISGGTSVALSGSPAISGGGGDINVGKNSRITVNGLTARYGIVYASPGNITEVAPVTFTVVAPDDYSEYFEASDALVKSGLALRKSAASGDGNEQTVEIYRPHKITHCAEVPATCTADGTGEYWKCTNKDCGKLFSDADGNTEITGIPVKSALGHNKEGSVAHKDATCTEAGVKGGSYCTRCDDGKSEAETVIPANGHVSDSGTVTTAPACTQKGTKTYTCTVCKKVLNTEEIRATGHDYTWGITKTPTMTAGGTAAGVCENDNSHKETKTLPALTDTAFWTVGDKVEPTKDKDGSQAYISEYGTVTVPLPSHAKIVAAAKQIVEEALAGITATNTTTKESLQSAIDEALDEAAKTNEELAGVTVAVGELTRTEATESAAGSIRGSVSISCGEGADKATDNVSIDKPIAQLPEKHKHDDVSFTAWTKKDSLPTDAGNYYLTENVTLTETWIVPNGTTRLCLNGMTVSISSASDKKLSRLITIPVSATLNLYDCQNSGKITGEASGGVWNEGAFNMYGGKISGNTKANYGGGVRNIGTFEMYGGEISGNGAFYFGGGVYVDDGTFRMCGGKISGNTNDEGGGVSIYKGTFIVGGDAVISGNTYDGAENNVYLKDGQTIEIYTDTPLSGSASIGVTTKIAPTDGNPVSVTGHNKDDYSEYFHSDNSDYIIVDKSNVVQLTVKPHTHSLTQTPAKAATCTEDGNKAYYVCGGEGGCGKWFTDAAGTQEITDKSSVVISRTGHDYDETTWDYKEADGHAHACQNCDAHDIVQPHTPGAAATATTPQTCTVCGYIIAPAIGHTHSLTQTPAKSATCTEDGNKAYYVCGGEGGCGKWFTDAAGTQEITDKSSVVISRTGHDYDETTWGYKEADGHAHECQNCDAHDTVQPHTPGAAATATTPQTCTVCGYIIAPATGIESGTVTPEVKPGANAPATSISTPAAELENMLLTEEEKQQVQNGTNVRIVLEVQDAGNTVSSADKKSIKKALNGFGVGQYLNIDLYKLIGENRTDISETAKKIKIVVTVPNSLKNTNGRKTRTFAVIRVHDGKAERLEDLDSSAETITIETDRFSTYSIIYKDKTNGGSGGGNREDDDNDAGDDENIGGGNDTKQASVKDSEPKTGDSAHIELYATLAMIAGFSYLLLYFTDRKRGMTEEMKKELVSRLVGWAKRGGRIRRCLALAAIFVLLVYYHSIGKRTCTEWKEIYGE